jgi:hypothetical protein
MKTGVTLQHVVIGIVLSIIGQYVYDRYIKKGVA